MISTSKRDLARYMGGLDHAKPRKYHNTPTELDGPKFDSKAEAARYAELVLWQRAGHISELTVHPRYVIVDADDHGRAMFYEADFRYVDEYGKTVCEDLKSAATERIPLFRLKWRLVQQRYPDISWEVVTR
jgi:hypothetical protein